MAPLKSGDTVVVVVVVVCRFAERVVVNLVEKKLWEKNIIGGMKATQRHICHDTPNGVILQAQSGNDNCLFSREGWR